MSEELKRIEQLERTVAALVSQVDFLATQLGYKAPNPGDLKQRPDSSIVGQQQIPGDPRRTETGMGAILAPENSKFL